VLHSPSDVQPSRSSAPVATRIVRRTTTNEVYRPVVDIYGRRALMLRIDVPRSITAKGEAATRFALWSLLIVGIVVLVLILAIRQMILGPVSRMTRHAVRIAEHDDLTVRLALTRRRARGLAREFDKMVDKLEDAAPPAGRSLVRGRRRTDRERRAAQRRQCNDAARRHRGRAAEAPAERPPTTSVSCSASSRRRPTRTTAAPTSRNSCV
jgi:hypothetical protein